MSAFVHWDEKYNTGNYVIDYQHQRLVRLINDLEEIRLHDDLRPFLLNAVLDEVAHYTDYHFRTEEGFMEAANYSDFHQHQRMHQEFIKKLFQYRADCEKKTKRVDQEFCIYLKEWLLNHIAIEDPKFISEMVAGHGLV